MALNITTDYAVRILLYLASNASVGVSVSGKEIASEMNIPYNYFLKIVPNLKKAGFLISFQGKKGGYALKKQPADISIFDILHAMNDDIIINECLVNPSYCTRNHADHCAVHNLYVSIQEHIDQKLKSVSLEEVVQQQALIEGKTDMYLPENLDTQQIAVKRQ